MTPGLSAAFDTFHGFFAGVSFVLGACIGSFLNVLIQRIPKEESIVTPGSHCACGHPIAWYDNLPILSWFFLRGKARCCGRPISFRYPFVELLTALLFTACWQALEPAVAVCGWVLISSMIAATFIDLDHMVIPDLFTLGLGAVGIVLSFFVPALHGFHGEYYGLEAVKSAFAGLEGLLVGSGLVFWIAMLAEAVLRKEAMGFGDVKFVGAIGAFCGWHGAVFSVFGGAAVGTVCLGGALLWQKIRPSERASVTLGAHIPFGPMLAVGGALYFLWLRGPVDTWFANLSLFF